MKTVGVSPVYMVRRLSKLLKEEDTVQFEEVVTSLRKYNSSADVARIVQLARLLAAME